VLSQWFTRGPYVRAISGWVQSHVLYRLWMCTDVLLRVSDRYQLYHYFIPFMLILIIRKLYIFCWLSDNICLNLLMYPLLPKFVPLLSVTSYDVFLYFAGCAVLRRRMTRDLCTFRILSETAVMLEFTFKCNWNSHNFSYKFLRYNRTKLPSEYS
jgi:hypothetical protein